MTEEDGSGLIKNIVQCTLKLQDVQLVIENSSQSFYYVQINVTQVERLDTLIETWNIESQIEKSEDQEQTTSFKQHTHLRRYFDPIKFKEPLAEILSTRQLFC